MRFDERGDIGYQLGRMLNGGLLLDDNFKGALIEKTLSPGDNEVVHGLGYVPTGYIVLSKSSPGDLWSALENTWNPRSIFIGSSVGSQRVKLFVL